MKHIVPADELQPFLYWLRFEFGQSGNPHAHGLTYVAGNPEFDLVVKSKEALEELIKQDHPDVAEMWLEEEAEAHVSEFFDPYIREAHPCKDMSGEPLWKFDEPLYTLMVDNVRMPGCAKPQTINLLEELERVFDNEAAPDTSRLKHILLALIESGQRHDYHIPHAHGPPAYGKNTCARKGSTSHGKEHVYCRYLFPRELMDFDGQDKRGCIRSDPHRADLRNLFLTRNDSLINNFEDHLLLMNLGNIDWRALINLWSVLDYLTKYAGKGGKGSKHLGKVFEEVLDKIFQFEVEDGIHDMWRRTIMKFYSRILGDRDYSLFEVMHFGLRLPGVLSSFGNVHKASVSNWGTVKKSEEIAKLGMKDSVTNASALKKFNRRGDLKLPKTIHSTDLENISYYAFSRIYDVYGGSLIQKRMEKFVALREWVARASQTKS